MNIISKITNKLLRNTITTKCPICQTPLYLELDSQLFQQTKNFPIAISVNHCNLTIILYVDANMKIRGIESAINYNIDGLDKNNREISQTDARVNTTPNIDNLSLDERVLFSCNASCSEFEKSSIPNIIEKQILRAIMQGKELGVKNVSLRAIKEKMKTVESALNIKINNNTIESILNKYVGQGLIIRKEF